MERLRVRVLLILDLVAESRHRTGLHQGGRTTS